METHWAMTPRFCWLLAGSSFFLLIIILLCATTLPLGVVYAISFGAFIVTLFGSGALAVYLTVRTQPPSLRAPRQHGRHPV